MARTEIRITGFGGQGVILCGYVIGRAAALHGGRHATMIQSFGPEARGSACSAQVVLSDEEVDYPYIRTPSILIAMSDDAYRTYRAELAAGGTLLYETDLVSAQRVPGTCGYGVPATRIAEEVGRRIVVNMVMTGFFAATTDVLTVEAVREAVRSSVPPGTERLNLLAFERGVEHGRQVLEEAAAAPAGAGGAW